jgi:hypothetical protein
MGILFVENKPQEALPLLRRASEIHRSCGYPYGVTYWLLYEASARVELQESSSTGEEELQEIERLIGECIELSDTLSKLDTKWEAEKLRYRVCLLRADREGAVASLESLLHRTQSDVEIGEIHYRLWTITQSESSRMIALEIYETLQDQSPLFENFVKRLRQKEAA